MKAQLIVGAILVVAAFVGGFLPQYNKRTAAEQELASTQARLAEVEQSLKIAEFRNRLARIHGEASASNFGTAGEQASQLFTDMQEFVGGLPAGELRTKYEGLLGARDSIVAGLAKADSATAAAIYDLFLKM